MGIFLSRILKGLQYSLYLIFHPFKGFWDLKHEKKGNVYSAWVIVCLLSILLILRRQFTGFILNFNKQNEMNVLSKYSVFWLRWVYGVCLTGALQPWWTARAA